MLVSVFCLFIYFAASNSLPLTRNGTKVLYRNKEFTKLDDWQLDHIPTALSMSDNKKRVEYLANNSELYVSRNFVYTVFPTSEAHYVKILNSTDYCKWCGVQEAWPMFALNDEKFYEFRKFSLKNAVQVENLQEYFQKYNVTDPGYMWTANDRNVYILDEDFHLLLPREFDLQKHWQHINWARALFFESKPVPVVLDDGTTELVCDVAKNVDWNSYIWEKYFPGQEYLTDDNILRMVVYGEKNIESGYIAM